MWPRVICFDIDGTLINEKTDKVFKDALSVLEDYRLSYSKLCVASFRDDARSVLIKNNIHELFETIESPPAFACYSKSAMLEKIACDYGIHYTDMIFFDNLEKNCQDCNTHGFFAWQVDTNKGVCIPDLETAISIWRKIIKHDN